MDRHLTIVLFTTLILAVGVMPGTITNGSAQIEDDGSMGHSVSSFMQVSAVEADSTVERAMWNEAFENAENESEKSKLIEQRSEQLSEDLSTVRAQQKQLENGNGTPAHTDELNAHVTELRQSVQNTSQAANESNVSSESLSELRAEACNVSVPNESETVTGSNGTGLRCPPNSPGNSTTNNTTDTPQDPGDDSTNNTTDTPQDPGDDSTNNTSDTPQDPGDDPANNTTDTPQDPEDDPANNTTDTPQDPEDDPANNTTDILRESDSSGGVESVNYSDPILEPLQQISDRSSSKDTFDNESDRSA